MSYTPHDWWMICERTGIKFRRSEMVQEFSGKAPEGLWVHKSSLDPVHPQEYVTSIDDDPSVSPTYPDVIQSVGDTTLARGASSNDLTVYLEAGLNAQEDDPIGIVANNQSTFWTFIESIINNSSILRDSNGEILYDVNGEILYGFTGSSAAVVLNTPLHFDSDESNVVYLPSLNNEEWQ